MSTFVHIVAGPFGLLLEARLVHGIVEAGAPEAVTGGGFKAWRGRALPAVDLRVLLGRPRPADTGAGVDVVYGAAGDETLVILEADRVVGMRALDEQDFFALPAQPAPLHALFDSLFLDPATGTALLRFQPIPADLTRLWRAATSLGNGAGGNGAGGNGAGG